MVLSNIKARQQERGFTIVELLIVIVVIAILATITIVAYNGVQSRAKAATAADNASKVQQVAESINQDTASYPRLTADWTAAANVTAKLPAAISLTIVGGTGLTGALSASNATTTITYQYCGAVAAPAAGAATGGRIQYWDSSLSTPAVSSNVLYVGTGAAGLGVGAGTVCNTWVTPAS
jgi:prepilin-type N-terminal cleavage/methylation domain-containing protein